MAKDLRRRVLTAVPLVAAVLLLLLFAPSWAFAVVLAAALAVGALEWAPLAGCARRSSAWLYAAVVLALVAAAWRFAFESELVGRAVLGAGLAWWTLATLWLAQRWNQPAAAKLAAGLFTLLPAWYAVVALHMQARGPWLVLLLLCIVWAADVGAFFAGHRFGRTRLAPEISPGKTWEGVLGGVLLAVSVAGLGAALLRLDPPRFLALALAVVGVSIVGDLVESLLKRQAGVKDSGSLLPGHGGVLDRLDSLFAAAPVFLAGLVVVGSRA
jgi:phosphatidate cytidylyltransferase